MAQILGVREQQQAVADARYVAENWAKETSNGQEHQDRSHLLTGSKTGATPVWGRKVPKEHPKEHTKLNNDTNVWSRSPE